MRRLKTVRRPPIYPNEPSHLPCSSLTHPAAVLTPSIGVLRWIRVNPSGQRVACVAIVPDLDARLPLHNGGHRACEFCGQVRRHSLPAPLVERTQQPPYHGRVAPEAPRLPWQRVRMDDYAIESRRRNRWAGMTVSGVSPRASARRSRSPCVCRRLIEHILLSPATRTLGAAT